MGGVPGRSARIFISYRREDTAAYAGRLYDQLAERFGEDQIFMDVDSIALGLDFVEAINTAVASCDILIALIGSRWIDATDEGGRRRIDDDHDFVRLELEAALNRKVRVVPVLVEGAVMPSEEELPPSLSALRRRQALKLTHEYFRPVTSRLIQDIEHISGGFSPGSPASPSAREETGSGVKAESINSKHLALSFTLQEIHRIEIDNNTWFGTIKVDGRVVAKRFDLAGNYDFAISDNNVEIPAAITLSTPWAQLGEVTLRINDRTVYSGSKGNW